MKGGSNMQQIYGNYEGFAQKSSALFGLVLFHDFWRRTENPLLCQEWDVLFFLKSSNCPYLYIEVVNFGYHWIYPYDLIPWIARASFFFSGSPSGSGSGSMSPRILFPVSRKCVMFFKKTWGDFKDGCWSWLVNIHALLYPSGNRWRILGLWSSLLSRNLGSK